MTMENEPASRPAVLLLGKVAVMVWAKDLKTRCLQIHRKAVGGLAWRWFAWMLAVAMTGVAGAGAPAAPRGVDFHPSRILVMPLGGQFLPELEALQRLRGRTVTQVFPRLRNLHVVRLAEGEKVAEAVAQVRSLTGVAWAEPDWLVRVAGLFPNDPYFQNGTQWALNNYGQNGGVADADLDAPEGWDIVTAASEVIVAVVDSGIRATHEDLVENLWRNPLDGTPGFNALSGQHDPWDENGHGTHLAGIIAAVANNQRGVAGVAWRARLMACKFLDGSGNGYTADAISCLEFARSHGAHLINLSWGGAALSLSLSNALWSAQAEGMLLVAAAGNNAANNDLAPYYPASLPLENLVAVAASTRTDDRWAFSNYGAASVDLFAPGMAIYSTASSGDSAYESRNGSSMAAAHVSGALALMRQQSPGSSPAEILAALRRAVDFKPAFAGLCLSGGRLNLRKALDWPGIAVSSSNGMAQVRVTGAAGHSYVVAGSTNLTDWTALQTNVAAANGQWVFTDSESTNRPSRFYRALPGP